MFKNVLIYSLIQLILTGILLYGVFVHAEEQEEVYSLKLKLDAYKRENIDDVRHAASQDRQLLDFHFEIKNISSQLGVLREMLDLLGLIVLLLHVAFTLWCLSRWLNSVSGKM